MHNQELNDLHSTDGRCECRWNDNIKMGIKEKVWERVKWILLA